MRIFRFFLFILLIILIAMSFTISSFATDSKPIRLVGATFMPPEDVYNRAWAKFASLLKEYYSGPLEVELHNSGDLGTEKDFFEFMMAGESVDFGQVAPSWMASWNKKAGFMDTPFLFRSVEHWKKALESNVFKSIEEEILNNQGVRFIGYGGGGTRNIILNKPIETIEDLPNVKCRLMIRPNAIFGAFSDGIWRQWDRDDGSYFKTVYRWNLDKQEPNLIIDENGNAKVNE